METSMGLLKATSLSSDPIELQMKLEFLQKELEQMHFESNRTALINNFSELMYDSENEEEILSLLMYSLPQVVEFRQLRFFAIDKKSLSLREKWFIPRPEDSPIDVTDGLVVPLNFFGGVLADAVLQQESMTLENGVEEGDELSLRFNSDRYIILPLVSRNLHRKNSQLSVCSRDQFRNEEEYQNACLRSPDFPVIGAFWIDLTDVNESSIGAGISHATTLLHTAGSIIGESRMFEQIVSINERVDKDLRAARDVQNGLLPSKLPCNDVITSSARYITEDQVGGDYYDIFELGKGVYGIMVADASGHGTPSALIMAMTKILLKTFAQVDRSPSETLELVNTAIVNNAKTNKFITGLYAILDTVNSTIRYTSAGHCPQIWITKSTGEVRELNSDGMFIGMFPFLMLSDHSLEYTPGDNRLVFYTDGLTEASNSEGNMFGITRLANSALKTVADSPEDALEKILGVFTRFIRTNKKEDDLTLMIIDF